METGRAVLFEEFSPQSSEKYYFLGILPKLVKREGLGRDLLKEKNPISNKWHKFCR
jgi:hypothetical protein